MAASETFNTPLSWAAAGFSLAPYDLVLLPGGHDKAVKQIIESSSLRPLILDYFPGTVANGNKTVAAIWYEPATPVFLPLIPNSHGVMVLAWTKTADGKSVLYDRHTTTLPAYMENLAYASSRAFYGDYYLTYPETRTQRAVTEALAKPEQFQEGPKNLLLSYSRSSAFVVVDEGYVSARWPGDAEVFAEKLYEVTLARSRRS